MKIVSAFVISLDGKITKGSDPLTRSWASKEDHEFFTTLVRDSRLVVMGSGTYDAAKELIKATPDTLRIIMTSKPEAYTGNEVPGQLEFTSESPREVVERFKPDYDEMLMVGGGRLFTEFLKEKLIDELYLTVEPKLFGEGADIITTSLPEVDMKLLESKQLNENGTLLLHYSIMKK